MDEHTRRWLADIFRTDDLVPADIVPGSGLTLDDLRRQSDLADTWVNATTPAQVVEDVDGNLIGLRPGETVPTHVGGTWISRAQMDALGLTEDDLENNYPGIHLAPDHEERSTP